MHGMYLKSDEVVGYFHTVEMLTPTAFLLDFTDNDHQEVTDKSRDQISENFQKM